MKRLEVRWRVAGGGGRGGAGEVAINGGGGFSAAALAGAIHETAKSTVTWLLYFAGYQECSVVA